MKSLCHLVLITSFATLNSQYKKYKIIFKQEGWSAQLALSRIREKMATPVMSLATNQWLVVARLSLIGVCVRVTRLDKLEQAADANKLS